MSGELRHAFTVDLEDWYHGIPIATESKRTAERRLHVGTDKLLSLLAAHDVQGTFFVLGPIAREHPALLRRIAEAGHDIGSHGQSHDLLYEMTPARFREETRASVRDLEDCIGRPVRSYRAAYFSVTRRSLWALDILAGEEIRWDSSIFPVKNWRYGIPDHPRHPVRIETTNGPLYEFPLSTRRWLGRNVPTTGGAYFRLYPYRVTRHNIRASEAEGMPVVFYLHPWELDPAHPLVRFRGRAMVTHYLNLRSTEDKLARLLREFRFTTLKEALKHAVPE
jgi:polysaccharide deacetylase family protein (PEP-CTERM system associated)